MTYREAWMLGEITAWPEVGEWLDRNNRPAPGVHTHDVPAGRDLVTVSVSDRGAHDLRVWIWDHEEWRWVSVRPDATFLEYV